MKMHNPPHPGKIIREQCLKPLGLTITATAKRLGVTCKALAELVNGHSGISPEMAIRLSKAFGGSSETWLRLQLQYDLWQAERRTKNIQVTHFPGVRRVPNDETIEAIEAARNGEMFPAGTPDRLLENLHAGD